MPASASTPRRVLIIRPSALGDVARTVPALVAIRRALPDATIDWLVQDIFADAIRHHPALNNVVAFPRKRFAKVGRSATATREFKAWARQLREAKYDAAIDLQGLLRSGLFTWLTRAPRRVGFNDAREFGWLGYNERYPVEAKLHTVDRMLTLVEAAGLNGPAPASEPARDMRLYVGPDEQRWFDNFQRDNNLTAGGYFTIAPTARWRSKCWPIERYIEITRRLLDAKTAGQTAVVLASPSEREQVQPLLDAFSSNSKYETQNPKLLCPSTTVGQMMAILSQTRLLIANDSAPLHIAVGFNRPIVAIFGPTDPSQVGPYRRDDTLVGAPGKFEFHRDRDDQSLISRVNIEDVWNKSLEQIQTREEN